MHVFPYILARDEGLMKLAIFVIVAIIWGIGGLVSAAKKASEQAKRRAAAMRQAAAPPMTQVMQSLPPVTKRQALSHRKTAPVLPKSSGRSPAPVPRPVAHIAQQTAAPAAVRLVPHGANPIAIRRWLRPASLRKQFILTELLQPPIALRQTQER